MEFNIIPPFSLSFHAQLYVGIGGLLLHVVYKVVLQILLVIFLIESQEVEIIGVFREFLGEITQRSRKHRTKIRYSLPLGRDAGGEGEADEV